MSDVVIPKPKSAAWVRNLTTKAFVIEAITDKPGCTTRYAGLPGKPLESFLLSGINSAEYLAKLRIKDNHIFLHNPEALLASSWHRESKYVNFGLLEIMFPVVAARLAQDDPKKVVDEVVSQVKNTTNQDVRSILECRRIAWSTSNTPHKKDLNLKDYEDEESVWSFYTKMYENYDTSNSNHNWANQFKLDLPVLRNFLNTYLEKGEYLKSTKTIFLEQQKRFPEVATGILADMCAAALFLYLSFPER